MNDSVFSTHLSIKLLSLASPGLKPKGSVLTNRANKLGLSCKANKCSDAGAGDLGVLPAQETSPAQPDQGECRRK